MKIIQIKLKGSVAYSHLHAAKADKFGTKKVHLSIDMGADIYNATMTHLTSVEGINTDDFYFPSKEQPDGSFRIYMDMPIKGRKKDGSTFIRSFKVLDINGDAINPADIGKESEVTVSAQLMVYDFTNDKGEAVRTIKIYPKVIEISSLVKPKSTGAIILDDEEESEF